MPIIQGTGSFSVGRDCQLVLMGPFGRVDIPNVTHFDCKQDTSPIKVDRLDGIQMNAILPKGWNFTIEAERAGPDLDELFAAIEESWYGTGFIAVSTLYQYVTEPNGSSAFQYTNGALRYDNPGDWKSDASVKQRLTGMADRRIIL